MLPQSIKEELDSQFAVSEDVIAAFRRNGYVKLPGVHSGRTISFFEQAVTAVVLNNNPIANVPLMERSTYKRAFIQVTNLWQKDERVKQLVFCKRLAGIAAALMGTRGVRLYHDQALYKEPGGGITPWHADQYYWPLATEKCCTVWIPLQETPRAMGPLAFAARSHEFTFGRDLPISDESEKRLQAALAEQRFVCVEQPFTVGEVSFHYGWTFHRAGPNSTDRPRKVMTVIYLDNEMRLAEPRNDAQRIDREAFCPGVEVGCIINSPLNPVLFVNTENGAN